MNEPLNRTETIERKREEILRALRAGRVRDPIFTPALLVSLAISAAVSVGTSLLTAALTKRQRVTQGDRGGQEFQIQRAEQGTPIPEIYGADPGDGLGGGIVVAPIIVWLSRDAAGNVARKHISKSRASGGKAGGRPKAPDVETISYDLDVLLLWGKGRLTLRRLWAATDTIYQNIASGPTGIPDPTVDPDDPYDPGLPHAPLIPYERPAERFSGLLLGDGDGVSVGTLQAGSYAGIAVYEGAPDQLPDSVVEAAVDALYGEGSTPAYRGRTTTRLSNFFLTKYQDVFPPMKGLLEHAELKTLADIFGHWCERAGLTPDDYDFTDIADIPVRGFVVVPPYTPKEVMTALARIFNCYFYESDKIYCLKAESAPTFAVADSELGWVDEMPGDDIVLPELGGEVPVETDIPRRVSIRYYDPARNYEQNIQGEVRQVTTGQREDVLEVQLVMTADEVREAAQRELYQEDVEAVPHSFSLSYEHIYRNPGDVVTVTRSEGFTHQIRLTSIKPGWVVECEGVAIDTAVYTQPVDTSGGSIFEPPPVAIPGMTMAGFIDGPPLRDAETGQIGFYAYAYKRRGDGDFAGAALYVDRGLDYELLATFDKEATAGVTASVLTGTTGTTGFVADAVTVDLHDVDATLESFTQADLLNGAGLCFIGDELCQILDAEREPDTASFPARWYLSIGLRARRGTEAAIGSHVSGERFVLVDDAVKLVQVDPDEVGQTRSYKMVTSGQSLDDAAELEFTFTAGKLRYSEPRNLTLARLDATNGSPLLSSWDLPAGSEVSADERYLWRAASVGVELRRHTVQGNYSEAAQWYVPDTDPSMTSINPGLLTISESGAVTSDANVNEIGIVRARQTIYGDCRVRFKLDSRLPPLLFMVASAVVACEVDTTTNEFIAVDHYWQDGDEVNFLGGIPTTSPAINGDQYGTGNYRIVNATSDRFQISETEGGAPLDITAAGAGQLYFQYTSIPYAQFNAVVEGGVAYVKPELASLLKVRALAGGECVIELKSGRVNYYVNDLTTPRYVSGGPPWRHPYSLYASLGALDGSAQAAINVTIEHTNPRSFLYTREMQENDFPGGIPSTVSVSVSRLSTVGEGLEATATG